MRCNTNSPNNSRINIVLEDALLVFLVTLIPKLLSLGGPPTSLGQLWEPMLSSILAALYSYMRSQGKEKPEEEPE